MVDAAAPVLAVVDDHLADAIVARSVVAVSLSVQPVMTLFSWFSSVRND